MPELTTRIAQAADRARVERLLGRSRAELGYQASEPLPFGKPGEELLYVLLAEVGEEAVGMLSAQRCHLLARGASFLLLGDLYVHPDHRRRGVARALMSAAKELAARMRCGELRLMVPDFNVAALTTVARAGFTRPNELLLSHAE
jgi:GNAT superfamily N-acetyltransferase